MREGQEKGSKEKHFLRLIMLEPTSSVKLVNSEQITVIVRILANTQNPTTVTIYPSEAFYVVSEPPLLEFPAGELSEELTWQLSRIPSDSGQLSAAGQKTIAEIEARSGGLIQKSMVPVSGGN